VDFTVSKYEELIKRVNAAKIPVYGILDWMTNQPERGIFIRHDVDRNPKNSLEVAKLESDLGWKTTYYFRIVSASYNEEIINEIAGLGHEIGYHYEDLSLANGDYEKAIQLFNDHLSKLRTLSEIKTVAMHGRPLSKYDNRHLWNKYKVKDYGLHGEAFLDIDYSNVFYFTDTGRNWIMDKNNLRYKTLSRNVEKMIRSTDDLIEFMTSQPTEKFALITHPERWSDNKIYWMTQLLKDTGINQVKKVIKASRKLTGNNA